MKETIKKDWKWGEYESDLTEVINSLMDKDNEISEQIADEVSARENAIADVETHINALPNNETLIDNVAEIVKTEVPLVKSAEQPTIVGDITEMIDTSKVYVMTDGYFYKYIETESSYRFSSDDFVVTAVGTNGDLTSGNNRIATKELVSLDDGTVSISCPSNYQYFIYLFDSTSTYIGKTSWVNGNLDDVLNATVASGTKSGAKYCRISLRDNSNWQANLTGRIEEFVTNITITKDGGTTFSWVNTGLAYNQPTDYEDRVIQFENELEEIKNNNSTSNVLYGKTAIFDGDSICNGSSAQDGKSGWAGRIGDNNNMIWENYGTNGGTISAETQLSGSDLHWISRTIDTIHTDYPSLDYLIIEGGTNDADLLSDDKLGTLNETDYSGTYDDTTFIGALETLFYKATSYYPYAKIGYIVAQKMGLSANAHYSKRYNFFEVAMQVCEKWGIPYINLWDGSHLNPHLNAHYDSSKTTSENREAGSLYTDGQHLTTYGYDVVTPKIEAWMRTL